jgi:hypothetical protein
MIARSATGISAFGAGMAWLTWETLRVAVDGSTGSDCASGAEYAGDTAFAVAGLLSALTLLGLAAGLTGVPHALALLGAASGAIFGVANGVEHCVFEPLFLLYAAGGLVFVVSTTLLGASILVTGALNRWIGVLLVVEAVAPMMLSFDRNGAALQGAAWLARGVVLLAGSAAPAPRRQPIR